MEFLSISHYPYYILIGIPLFFLVKWLFRKKQEGLQKNILTIIVTIVLTPVVFTILSWTFLMTLFYEPTYRFSSSGWKTDKENRYRMLEDLLNKKRLINKDTFQLKEMLGDDFTRQTDGSFYYSAGTGASGFGIRFHFLRITISEGKVIKAERFHADD